MEGETMKDYDKIKTIGDAVLRLQRAFVAAGMSSSPVSIELGSRDDEYALKHLMRPDMPPFVEPYMTTDDPDCVGKIVGMKVLRRRENRPPPRMETSADAIARAMEREVREYGDYHSKNRR